MWQKLEEGMLNRLTPSNIRTLEKSAAARDAIKILAECSESAETLLVSQSSVTLVRDFLFTQMFTDDANRPGVSAHMTMDEYKNIDSKRTITLSWSKNIKQRMLMDQLELY